MKISVLSDKGLIRDKNQDSIKTVQHSDGTVLVVVCDGIGGAKAGEVASSMASEKLTQSFLKFHLDTLLKATEWLDEVLHQINDDILQTSKQNLNFNGMGTTLVALIIHSGYSLAVNIGDSRIYRFFQHELIRISNDHSLVFEMVERGEITEEQASEHPQRNYLTNALGINQTLRIDFFDLSNTAWQYLLLSSDGLHGYVEEHMIRRVLVNEKMTLSEKCATLVDLANEAGGYDNISVGLVMNEEVA